MFCYYYRDKYCWYNVGENYYIILCNLCVSNVFYIVKYGVEEYDNYIDNYVRYNINF